tara:strand:+ start:585 stop:1886 length:1302 start_codon:yes stop_codon:yes gene_type:complete
MVLKIRNLFSSKANMQKTGDFQDLEHIDGVSISSINANLYNAKRDDLVLFYFREGANYSSVYTKSKIVSENIKWNQKIKSKKIKALLINTRNANAFTGKEGSKGVKILSEELSNQLSEKQKIDEESPVKIKPTEILFASTGTIGEKFPTNRIKNNIPELIENIKYTQNKYIWVKAANAIRTTDLKSKMSMDICKIGNSEVKIYGIAKGSGMIFPNMATTLGFVFTDASLSSSILKQLLNKNIKSTFNAISCDGDTSTNDMVSIFATNKAKHTFIKSATDPKLIDFDKALNSVLLNLAKRVAADGEGASKFITINTINCKNEEDAKKISFSVANSPLVKTAIAGEDANWGRIIMAIGKSYVNINVNKLSLRFGKHKIVEKGEYYNNFNEELLNEYMKEENIEITIDIGIGSKNFTAYTMDLTKKYIEINADYRS